MQPNQPYQPAPDQQQQQPQPAVAFQSSAPIGPMQGQAPLGQLDPRMMMPLPKEHKLRSLITIIILSVFLAAATGFGIWAFMERQDYKTNSDQKSAEAVEKANAAQKLTLDAEYEEKAKLPYEIYSGPSTAGSIKIQYPRTWSAYVVEDSQTATPVNGYFHPGYVPNTISGPNATAFALRLEVLNQPYDQILKQYESQIKTGEIVASAASLPSVQGAIGTKLTGQIVQGVKKIQGTMVIFAVRDKTIKLSTESNSAFLNDFENGILPVFSFVP